MLKDELRLVNHCIKRMEPMSERARRNVLRNLTEWFDEQSELTQTNPVPAAEFFGDQNEASKPADM